MEGLEGAVEALIGHGAATAVAQRFENGAALVVRPSGWEIKDVTSDIAAHDPKPSRGRGSIVAQDLDSMIRLAQEIDGPKRVYFDRVGESFKVVLNDSIGEAPGWRDWTVNYRPIASEEFKAWTSINKKPQTQADFAEFLEDHIGDIVGDATELLSVATTLQAKTKVEFASGVRLDNGQVQLTYNETIEARAGARGSLTIPRTFDIAIPVYARGDHWKISCRLKYRLADGGVRFWFEMDRLSQVIDGAQDQMVDKVKAAGLAAYYGH